MHEHIFQKHAAKNMLPHQMRKMKAENQRRRRAAIKKGIKIKGMDYDHRRKKFVSVKVNRGNGGRGTKKE